MNKSVYTIIYEHDNKGKGGITIQYDDDECFYTNENEDFIEKSIEFLKTLISYESGIDYTD